MPSEIKILERQPRQPQYDPELRVSTWQYGDTYLLAVSEELRNSNQYPLISQVLKEFNQDPESFPNLDPEGLVISKIRSVRRLGEFGDFAIALKGSGSKSYGQNEARENLHRQFISMRSHSINYLNLGHELLVRPAEVYAYLRYPTPNMNRYQEWIFMEAINGIRLLSAVRNIPTEYGIDKVVTGYEERDYPDLVTFVRERVPIPPDSPSGFVSNAELSKALEMERLRGFSDLKGSNILLSRTPKREYIIIDQN